MNTFQLQGLTLEYVDQPYNRARQNERAVEVALGLHLLASARRALEVGAVLPHYLPGWPAGLRSAAEHGSARGAHDVIDLHEKYPGVANADVLHYVPRGTYDLVLSISTLEHVGHAEHVQAAVTRMKGWLASPGLLFITLPHGYRPDVDALVRSGRLGMDVLRMDKVDQERHLWAERPLADPPQPYGRPTPNAQTLYLLFYGTGERRWEVC